MRSPIRLAQTALVQRSENGDSSAAVLEDTTELSDVSFLSRDREHLESGKFYSDDSDEELVVEQRRRKALCYSLSCCGMCVLFGLFVAFHSFSTGPMSVWTSASAWGEPMQEFPFLGEGLCLGRANQLIPKYNTSGDLMQFFQPASPEQCQAQCQQDAQCSGFVTHGNTTCSLISEEEGFPAAADATPRFRCYWRHDFLHNSVGIYDPPRPLVPKVIWSYWENVHQVDANLTQQAIMHAFLELCQKSWRTLNPGWEIRVLDQDTVWQYISKADLPAGFDNLKVQHRSDAIRLALLVEYGGVWMDATLLLLRPLSMVIQDIDPSNRFFYVNRGLLGIPIINTKYDRYTADFHVENWFFAAPQQDPLLVRTFSCVKKMHQEGDTKHLSDYGNLFTQRQLEDLDALAEWAYLATDACIFKALDEDRALTQWWLSPSVHRRNFLGHLNPLWFQNPNQTLIDIFYRVNPEIVQTLTGGALLLLKFTTDMRKALLEPLSPLELYGCVESSWSIVLAAIGIANITKCEELRKPGANEWL